MIRLTIKNLLARKLRLLTTSIAVLLGVAFVVGSLGLASTLNKVFDDIFDGVYQNVDVVVRGPESAIGEFEGGTPEPVPASVVDTVRNLPGVARAEGYVEFPAQLVGSNGKPVGGNGPPASGANWIDGNINAFSIAEGRAPAAANEAVVDAGTAKGGKVAVGDTITILTGTEPIKAQLVGIAKFGDLDSAGGTSYIFFTNARAVELQNGITDFTEIDIQADSGQSAEQLRDAVKAAVPANLRVDTGAAVGEEQATALKDGLSFISIIPLVFGAISLLVSAFIINNTFAILLAQRSSEMALIRAIGARRRQVLVSVIVEAFIVGLIASLLGLLAGIGVAAGLMALLRRFVADFPSTGVAIDLRMILIGLVSGIGITVVAAFFPALRSSKIPPLAALREVSIDRTNASIPRIVIGFLILAGSLAGFYFGLLEKYEPTYTIGAGIVAALVAVYVLGPIYAKPLSALLGWPAAKLRGMPGSLARQNAMRNPRRTASTAAALLIGVTLVTFCFVFFSSLKATTAQLVDRSIAGDFVVRNSQSFGGPGQSLDPNLATKLAQSADLDTVVTLGTAPALIAPGDTTFASVIDPIAAQVLIDPGVTSGDFDNVDADGFAVFTELATAKGWKVGDRVPVEFSAAGPVQLEIVAIYDDQSFFNRAAFSRETVQQQTGAVNDSIVLVKKKGEVPADQARASIEAVTATYLNVEVQDRTQFRATIEQSIGQILNLVLALLALAVIIALFGIANTLALSVFERTREIGLLRAVGMTRRQTRAMIRWESVTLALSGTAVGLILGTAFGAALVTALKDEGIEVLSIPWLTLLVIGAIAVLAGFLVALLPARRASRLKVLDAISTA